jgi:hypothetical protein
MGVNRCRKKALDRSVLAITLKKATDELQGLYTNIEEEAAD